MCFQVMVWQLLTGQPLYGALATRVGIADALVGRAPLPTEQRLSREVRDGLANKVFESTVLAMLSRDPAARPTAASLVQQWMSLLKSAPSLEASLPSSMAFASQPQSLTAAQAPAVERGSSGSAGAGTPRCGAMYCTGVAACPSGGATLNSGTTRSQASQSPAAGYSSSFMMTLQPQPVWHGALSCSSGAPLAPQPCLPPVVDERRTNDLSAKQIVMLL